LYTGFNFTWMNCLEGTSFLHRALDDLMQCTSDPLLHW